MMVRLNEKMVRWSQSDKDDPWRLSNGVLYDLCREYPRHINSAEIIAKVLLIGRVYAASIERGRGETVGPGVSNDMFYIEHVTRVLRKSKLDDRLRALKRIKQVDESSTDEVLDTHGYLVRVFEELTEKGKRSLASKYLHFHCPHLFFIYDSRAMAGIRKLAIPAPSIRPIRHPGADPAYQRFVAAALRLRAHVASRFRATLTPRELDRLLLAAYIR